MRLPPLYTMIDSSTARHRGWAPADVARACLAGGARLLQVRDKEASGGDLLRLTEVIVELARPFEAAVIVNDRADVARLAGAAGVHVGQGDLAVAGVRRIVGNAAIVGLSTHDVAQIDAAAGEDVTYLAVGPVFATGTKDTGYAPVGLALVREAAARSGGRPIVAIGGITLERAPSLLDAGAASLAVAGDLFATGDPEAQVRAYGECLRSQVGDG